VEVTILNRGSNDGQPNPSPDRAVGSADPLPLLGRYTLLSRSNRWLTLRFTCRSSGGSRSSRRQDVLCRLDLSNGLLRVNTSHRPAIGRHLVKRRRPLRFLAIPDRAFQPAFSFGWDNCRRFLWEVGHLCMDPRYIDGHDQN
jgi:hypothetical protein